MSTPSETLVAAADLIRDLAAKATAGPWEVNDQNYPEAVVSAEGDYVVSGGRWGGEASVFDQDGDARWIAALSPALAPMIIGLLVSAAEHVSQCGAPVSPCRFCAPALALAARVLGEETHG